MPNIEVAGLTMVPGDHKQDRLLFAASHGHGAWRLIDRDDRSLRGAVSGRPLRRFPGARVRAYFQQAE